MKYLKNETNKNTTDKQAISVLVNFKNSTHQLYFITYIEGAGIVSETAGKQ